jgi:hypothetical protein
VRKVWGGRGNLEEIEATGPHRPFKGLTLRLYDPAARQWRLYWANSSDGVMDEALIGGFKDGRGVFYNQDTYAGRTVFVRNAYYDVTADSYRFEQALATDGEELAQEFQRAPDSGHNLTARRSNRSSRS